MNYDYKNYCYYSNIDPTQEPLGKCEAGAIGIAVIHFASMKKMEVKDWLQIYSVKEKDESK
jgi:hypothetical protein